MKIAICEDEIKEYTLMKALLTEHYKECSIDVFDSGSKLLDYINANMPDIILLDIEMPGINGIETARKIRSIHPDMRIIFITGHTEFALEAFNVYASDYIVKPIDVDRLFKTLDRVNDVQKSGKKYIYINNQGVLFKIFQDDIIFIEKRFNKCTLYTDKFTYITIKPLKYFEKELDPGIFIKTHKAFIVNKNKIDSIISLGNQTFEIHFKGIDKTAALSRSAREYFKGNRHDF